MKPMRHKRHHIQDKPRCESLITKKEVIKLAKRSALTIIVLIIFTEASVVYYYMYTNEIAEKLSNTIANYIFLGLLASAFCLIFIYVFISIYYSRTYEKNFQHYKFQKTPYWRLGNEKRKRESAEDKAWSMKHDLHEAVENAVRKNQHFNLKDGEPSEELLDFLKVRSFVSSFPPYRITVKVAVVKNYGVYDAHSGKSTRPHIPVVKAKINSSGWMRKATLYSHGSGKMKKSSASSFEEVLDHIREFRYFFR